MQRTLKLCVAFLSLWLAAGAQAQDITETVAEGNYDVLGAATVTATKTLPAGFAPVNDRVTFVYDPYFHFYMRGYSTSTEYDRRAEFRDYGFVVVVAAGSPGGYYPSTPEWIQHKSFRASTTAGQVTLLYGYETSYVPTLRGFQTYVIYANLTPEGEAQHLPLFDDELRLGRGNFLFTGDGPEQASSLDLWATDAAEGERAIQVRTTAETGGTHWKLMLFANGNAAAFEGIDLSDYGTLVFWAKANRAVTLQGGFGTGDDSGHMPFAPLAVTTEYQRFEIDLTQVDRSDINTPFWIYMHKSLNPAGLAGVTVSLDGIELKP